MSLESLVSVARGASPADLLLTNARVVNTLSGEIEEASVAIHGDRIAGVGDYSQAGETIDLGGRFLAPGLIDGHIHVESSMLSFGQYARAVVPRGVSAVVSDLHEIANVAGVRGIRYMLDSAREVPLDLLFMVPSCVPATSLETAGARLDAEDVGAALDWPETVGLGEMMNFPGVLFGDPGVFGKLALGRGKVIDGHAPGLSGRDLNAYVSAGILSDHESTGLEEAREKLRRGMYIMVREGTSEKNLDALLPLARGDSYRRCFFVVDDRSCADLLRDGDIDAVVRGAVRRGLDPVRAIQMATINTALYFRQPDRGAVAPGYLADLVVFDDLHKLDAGMVFHRGRLVARGGEALFPLPGASPGEPRDTMHVKPFPVEALRLPARGTTFPVIGIVPGQIVTRRLDPEIRAEAGSIAADTVRDFLKLAVVERHRASGNIGLGLVNGLGLKRGAIASSIAHDSHNIVAAGVADADIYAAVREVERLGGGLAVACDSQVRGSLALPIAGLLSPEPLETVVAGLESLKALAADLGCALPDPFAVLAFLALPVIPELRLTDLGLVDVGAFKIIG